jgi:hypothetical protein
MFEALPKWLSEADPEWRAGCGLPNRDGLWEDDHQGPNYYSTASRLLKIRQWPLDREIDKQKQGFKSSLCNENNHEVELPSVQL